MHSLEHDQDISNIVDQVLSCIDQFEDFQNHNNSSNNPGSSYRDGLETLLCHNCGALMKTKTEETCRQCGTQMPLNNEADNNSGSDAGILPAIEPLKKPK